MLRNLPSLLTQRLQRPLPGRAAHIQFEPELSYGRHSDPPQADSRPAAVIALLYPCESENDWQLPLIVRPVDMVDHPGQVSFPGGMVDSGETAEAAALRELQEELGVDTSKLQVLGELSKLHLYSTHFSIRPFVAAMPSRPAMRPNRAEVAEVLEVPLRHLLDAKNYSRQKIQRGGLQFWAPHILWQSHPIWGATALMLSELLAILAELPIDSDRR